MHQDPHLFFFFFFLLPSAPWGCRYLGFIAAHQH